jgi:hypothetical protein
LSLATQMLTAYMRGDRYPPDGIEDSAENRDLWNQIADEVQDMRAKGIGIEVPSEYADGDD